MSPATRAWIKDAAERVAWTAVQGFASALLLSDALNLDALQAALLGATMAVLALVKSTAAAQLGGDTAQLGAKTYSYTEPGPGSAGVDV